MYGVNVPFFALALVGYTVAVILYMLVFLRRQQHALLASRVLWATWVVHSVALVSRWVESGHAPLATKFESLSFYGWGLTLLYLLVERASGYRAMGAIVAPLALGLLTAASAMPKEVQPLVPALQSIWLPGHVSVSFLAYAAMTMAAGLGVVYLLQERQLKVKRPLALYYRLPPLQATDRLINRLVALGFPLMTLSLVTGAIWAEQEWGAFWSWDPKQNMALAMWLVYVAYFYARRVMEWRGRRTAWLVLVGFVLIWATLLGSGFLGSTLHAGDFARPK